MANNATNSDAKAAAKKAALEAEKARLAATQGEGLYKTKPKIPSAMIEQTKTSAEAAAAAAAETKVVRKQLDELQAEREDRDVEEVRARRFLVADSTMAIVVLRVDAQFTHVGVP